MVPYEIVLSQERFRLWCGLTPMPFPIVVRRGPGDGGSAGGEAETVQDFANRFPRLDGGENPEGAATLGAFQHIDGPNPAHELSSMHWMV